MTSLEKTWVYSVLSVLCLHMATTPARWFDVVWGASVGLGYLVAAVVTQIRRAE